MKTTELLPRLTPEKAQYQTAFSSLTVAANLLLKAKTRLETGGKNLDMKKKDSFDLLSTLSTISAFTNHS